MCKDKDLSHLDSTIVDEDVLWRIKREGQARSRQLVRDGIRKKEDNFLFPREVVKQSKVKFRGL